MKRSKQDNTTDADKIQKLKAKLRDLNLAIELGMSFFSNDSYAKKHFLLREFSILIKELSATNGFHKAYNSIKYDLSFIQHKNLIFKGIKRQWIVDPDGVPFPSFYIEFDKASKIIINQTDEDIFLEARPGITSNDYYSMEPIEYFELSFLFNAITKIRGYLAPGKAVKKGPLSFQDLFIEKDIWVILKGKLKIIGYIDEEHNWHSQSGNKSDLISLFYALKDNELISGTKVTPGVTLLYSEFGFKVGKVSEGNYITSRNFTDRPPLDNEDYKEFDSIILDLFKLG